MLRFLALVVLLALIAAGLYYWQGQPAGVRLPLKPESLGEVGQKLRDTALTGSVKAALELDRNLKPFPIAVDVEEGVVTLRGEVSDEALRQRADAVAGAVPDVRQVVNHLGVAAGLAAPGDAGRSLGESLDDKKLEVQVRLAFSLRRELKGTDLAVSAYRREVTLSGEVSSEDQRRLAAEVAQQTGGVASVTDRVRVRGQDSPERLDSDRRTAVQRALAGNPNLAPYKIEVRLKGGRIMLEGRVRSGAERDLAGLLARDAAGAAVENTIVVRP